ncbi:hypothetical protein M8J77_001683 [Diaphorina citri]|nr:hypothetical protein M8J77_001683 [Diaphorina citri]
MMKNRRRRRKRRGGERRVPVRGFEPDFLYPLENVTIAQGRDAIFTCVVNNLGGHRVSSSVTDTHVNTGGSIVFPTDSSAMKVIQTVYHQLQRYTFFELDHIKLVSIPSSLLKSAAITFGVPGKEG